MIGYALQRATMTLPTITSNAPKLGTVVTTIKDLVERANTPAGRRAIGIAFVAGGEFAEQLILKLADGPIIKDSELHKYSSTALFEEQRLSAENYLKARANYQGIEPFKGIVFDAYHAGPAHFDHAQNRIVYGPLDKNDLFMISHETVHALEYMEMESAKYLDDFVAGKISYAEMEQRTMQAHRTMISGGKHSTFIRSLVSNQDMLLEDLAKFESRAGSIVRVEKQFRNKFWYGMKR